MAESFLAVLMSVVIGTLAAIVIALRYVLIIERRMAKMELHLEKIVMKIAKEEDVILEEERKLERKLLGKEIGPKKAATKKSKKKASSKKTKKKSKK